MNGKKIWTAVAAAMVLMALTLPVWAQGGGRIKVTVENASLRDKPNMDAEILEENIPLGTVFNIEKKTGEFYEVKYQSKLGVMITGYIHEMYVEVLPAEPAPKPAEPAKVEQPKVVTPPAQGQVLTRPRVTISGAPQFEIGLGFGLGFGSFMPSTSSYSYDWGPVIILRTVTEAGTVGHKIKSPLGLGFSLAYFFPGGFGLKLRIDPNFKQSIESARSAYTMDWTWNNGITGSANNNWPVSGDMSVMPISLDFVYKFVTEGTFQPYVNAGLSIFTGKANVSTNTGYGITFLYDYYGTLYQVIDYVAVPLQIRDESLGSAGFNLGLGADIHFSPSVALNIDAAYFIGKTFDLDWAAVPGIYQTNLDYFGTFSFEISQDELRIITDNLPHLQVKTSFFKIMLGFKVGF